MDSKLKEIHEAIPHREPFLYVDEIVELSENKIITRKKITGREDFFKGHYPNSPIMPGVLLMECVFQAGALFISKKEANSTQMGVPVLTRVDKVKLKNPVYPGDELKVEASLVEKMSSAWFMKGLIQVEGKKILSLEFACTLLKDSP